MLIRLSEKLKKIFELTKKSEKKISQSWKILIENLHDR